MKYHDLLEYYANVRWLGFVFVVLIFSFILKKQVVMQALVNGLSANAWDTVFIIICDPFFIFYFLLPLWIFISARLIGNDFNELNLIRLSSYRKWIKHSFNKASLTLLVMLGLIASIVTAVSIDFKMDFSWSEFSKENTYSPIYFLSSTDLSPISIFWIQIIYLFLFLLVIHAVLLLFFLFVAQKAVMTFSFGIIVWIGIIISFKVFTMNKWLNISNYVSLPSFFNAFETWIFPILCYAVIIAAVWVSGKYKK